MENGDEVRIWEGKENTGPAPFESSFKPSIQIFSKIIKLYLDSSRVEGWNEIDAVEVIGRDGSHQWAAHASASSTFADHLSEPGLRAN